MNYTLKKIRKDSGKVYALGDIHGCYTALMEYLKKIGFDFQNDLVISVGDLIDRGKENIQCLELMNEDWFEAVGGNHELIAYKGQILGDESYYDCWYGNGGHWLSHKKGTDDYYWAQDLIKETANLPDIIELSRNGKTYVVCHAGYPRDIYSSDADLSKREVWEIKWNRARINAYIDGFIGDKAMTISGADHFFFGHTPLEEVSTAGNCTYIDTGLVNGGVIGIVDVDQY